MEEKTILKKLLSKRVGVRDLDELKNDFMDILKRVHFGAADTPSDPINTLVVD